MLDKLTRSRSAISAALLLVPFSADALTLDVYDTTTDNFIRIEDGGAGDADGKLNGKIVVVDVAVGDALVSISTALQLETAGSSTLELTASNARAGANALFIDASHDGFTAASQAPLPSLVHFSMNASSLVDGDLAGIGCAGAATDAPCSAFNDGGRLTDTGDDINVSAAVPLPDPFSMSINTTLAGGATTTFSATLTAQVPVPAAGLMLLTALGGLGVARRHRKAA